MIKTTQALLKELDTYRTTATKIERMVNAGELYVVKRGLYETDISCPPAYLSGVIYGPSYLSFEYALSVYGMPYQVKLMDLSSMFSGKIHAILAREYVKGRDLYDYIWYLQHRVSWNQKLLNNALLQTNSIKKGEQFDREEAKMLLLKRFSEIDFDLAKRDVLPFLRHAAAIDVWRADFFKKITVTL